MRFASYHLSISYSSLPKGVVIYSRGRAALAYWYGSVASGAA